MSIAYDLVYTCECREGLEDELAGLYKKEQELEELLFTSTLHYIHDEVSRYLLILFYFI
jgi:hypothetical protein